MALDNGGRAVLDYVRRAGVLNLSDRAIDDLVACVGFDGKQVAEHLDALERGGLLVRHDADGLPDPLTGRKPTLLRLTLAGDQAIAGPSTG